MKKKIFFLEGNTDGTVGGSYYLMYDLVLALDRSKFEPVVGFHTDNILVEKLRENGIETHVIEVPKPFSFGVESVDKLLFPIKKTLNFLKRVVWHGVKLSSFLKKQKIDLVNLNNSITRNHFWMIATLISGTKCMTHEMGINKQFSFLSRFFGKRLESIVCLSYAIKDNMVKLGVDYPNISVIHCGINTDRYKIVRSPDEIKQQYAIEKGRPVIGVVGNIKPWKGQETIVRAAALLKDKYPNLACMLVGGTSELDEAYRSKLEDLCHTLSITENIIFTGFQKNSIEFMNTMDIVVHTSVEPEPFGIVTLEAMLLSKPYVSTTIGGPAEVVENGKTGLLVDPGNPELLAEAIDRFLSDREYAESCGKLGFKKLSEEFSFEKNVSSTVKIYQGILDI